MKNPTTQIARTKAIALLFMTVICALPAFSQDTLHLNYVQISTKLPDSTDKKIDQWIKKLNGQHVDLTVYAYYHKGEFKPYAQERADELFLILNRKARSLFTIQSIGPKKGSNSQRSMVDIVYRPSGGAVAAAPAAAKTTPAKTETKPAAEKTTAAAEPKKQPKTTGQSTAKTETKPAPEKEEPATPAAKPVRPTATGTAAKNMVFSPSLEFKARKLMVVLMEENPKQVAKLAAKADELSAYKNGIQAHNDNVTRAFKSFWKESELGFITEHEVATASNSDWVLLIPDPSTLQGIPFMSYNVKMIYNKGKKNEVYEKPFKVSIHDNAPNDADLFVLMYKLKVYYNVEEEFNRQQLEETLAGKTLYVDKGMTEMTESDFKSAYPFPFTFVGGNDVISHSNDRDKNALYFKMDVNEGKLNLMIVDAETGAILARSDQGGINKSSFKKSAVNYLADEKKQMMDFYPLTIY